MDNNSVTSKEIFIFRDLDRQEQLDRFFYRFSKELLPIPAGDKKQFLDLGCGMAEFARFAISKGWSASVSDVSEKNVVHATELGLDAKHLDLNLPLPYNDKSFQVVVLIEVLEHIMNAETLVDEIFRILADDGTFLLSTPNYAFYKHRLNGVFGKSPPEEGKHFRFFIRRKLKKLLTSRGFKIIKKNSFGYVPLFNKILFRRAFGKEKIRFHIPSTFETIFAEHFVWLLQKNSNL